MLLLPAGFVKEAVRAVKFLSRNCLLLTPTGGKALILSYYVSESVFPPWGERWKQVFGANGGSPEGHRS